MRLFYTLLCFCCTTLCFSTTTEAQQKVDPTFESLQEEGLTLISDNVGKRMNELYEQNPELYEQLQQQVQEMNENNRDGGANCGAGFTCTEQVNVAVVFHYIYGDNVYANSTDTEAYIENTVVSAVNNYFNPDGTLDDNLGACYANVAAQGNCFNFCLASNDHPAGSGLAAGESAVMTYQVTDAQIDALAGSNNQTADIHAIAPAWSTCEYLNVYVIPNLAPPSGGFVIAGYTYLPNNNTSAQFSSIYMDYDFVTGGTTLAHEIGHWLGLEHTWGGANGCGTDDNYLGDPNCPINDTFSQDDSNISDACPGAANACNNGSCGSPDNFYNIMNYTNCPASQQFFSAEQYCSMYNTLDGSINIGCRNQLNANAAAKCSNCTLEVLASGGTCSVDETTYDACVTISGSNAYNLTASESFQTFNNVSPTPAGTEYCFTGFSISSVPATTITISNPADPACDLTVGIAAPCAPAQCPQYDDGTIDLTSVCNGSQVIMTVPQACNVTPAGLDVVVCWDQWGSDENYFELIDEANGTVVFTGTPTAAENETCVTYNVAGLSISGSYTVTIHDSYGDGMFNATCFGGASDGSVQVLDAVTGNVLLPTNVFEAQDGDGDGTTCEDTNADGPIFETFTGLVPTGVEVSQETVEILINGVVVQSFPNDAPCADEILGAIVTTDNICQPELITVGYNIICDLTSTSIAAGEFNIDVFPNAPAAASDMVNVDFSNAECGSCTPEIVYLADCNPVTVSVTETTAATDDAIGTASYDINFAGLNGGACCTPLADTILADITPAALDGDGNDCQAGLGTEDYFTFNFPALPNGAVTTDNITIYDNITLGDVNVGELCFDLSVPDDRVVIVQIFNDATVGTNTNGGSVWSGTVYGGGGTDGNGAASIQTCFPLNGDVFAGSSLDDFYIRVLEGTCVTAGTAVPTGATVNSITLEILVGNGLTSCDYTLDVPYNCECTAVCSLTDAQLTLDACNDAGTPFDATDDTFNFFLNPIGTNQGVSYTVSGGALAAPVIGNAYGGNVTFGPYLISDWGAGTTQTITITDATDPSCSITAEVVVPVDCSIECPTINSAGSANAVCGGQNFTITGFSATTTTLTDFPDFLLVYDTDVTTTPTAAEILDGLVGGPTDPGDITQFGEVVDATGTGATTSLADLQGFINNTCNVSNVDLYFVPADAVGGTFSLTCGVSDAVRLTTYPNFNVVTANDGSCNPVAYLELLNSDGTGTVVDTCLTIGDPLATSCAADLNYDFTTYDISLENDGSTTLAEGTICVTGAPTGTLTCGVFTATETFTVCDGESHDYNGTLIPSGTSQDITTLGANGCDLVTTVTVNAFPITPDENVTSTHCEGSGFAYTHPSGTIVFNEANPSGTETLQDANNCDYDIIVDLTFNALTADVNETYTGCVGDGYSYTSPSGTVYDETNSTGTETITDANNCDYTVTVALTFNALTADINETYTGCAGDGYSYTSPSGTVYDEANPTGTETITDANNCDYGVTVALTFNALTTDINETYTGCVGDGYSYTSPSGTVYDEANPTGTETITDANGCDYDVTVALTFNALTADINETYTGCAGDGYSYTSPSGTVYDEANPTGTETLQDANNCDYDVTVALTFNTLTADINETYTGCAGDGYSYTSPSGTVYDEANPTGTETITDANNCDYNVLVDLTFNALTADINETYTGCIDDGYSYTSPSGTVYDETNPTGTETLQDANNCDYNVTVNLVFDTCIDPCENVVDVNETYTGCAGDGYAYTSASGTVYDEANPSGTEALVDGNNCPYNLTVDLTFNALTTNETETYTGCAGDGYEVVVNGVTYNEINPTGTETVVDANGCNYDIDVDLTFNALTADINETYTGCVGDGYSIDVNGIIFDEVTPNGTETLFDANGCTYKVIVDLVFNALTPDETETYTGCENDGYSIDVNGTTYNESNPTGTETLTDANGCDYTVTIDLVFDVCIDPCDGVTDVNETYTGCSGDGYSVEINGVTYDEANPSGIEALVDGNDCPYNVIIDLTFNALTADETETYTGCENDGYSVDVNGTTYDEANPTGTETITDANGCDYTVTIDLVFDVCNNPCDNVTDVNETYTGCSGDGYSYTSASGTIYDELNPTGTETITDANDCSYDITVDLIFNTLTADATETYSGCTGDGYSVEINGVTYDETNPSGTEAVVDGNDCPYNVIIDLTFNALTDDETETYTGCENDGYSVDVNGTIYDEANPTGTETMTDANGCNYNVVVDLTFSDCTNPCVNVENVNETYIGCAGDGYEVVINGTTYDETNPSGTENVVDGNDCAYDIIVDLTFNALTADETETYAGCENDGYSVEVNGTTYDEATPTGTEVLTDANGCDYTVTIDLLFDICTDLCDTVVDIDTDLGFVCDGGSVDYNGITYDASNTPATLMLTDDNDCDYEENITLSFYTITENITTDLGSVCADGAIEHNGTMYNADNTPTTVTLTDDNGCDYSETITLTVIPSSENVNTYLDACAGETVDYNGETLSEENPTVSIAGTDENGCSYIEVVSVSFFPMTEDVIFTDEYCAGSGFTYTTTEGTMYDETNPSGSETVIDDNGCTYSISVELVFTECTDPCELTNDIEIMDTYCDIENFSYTSPSGTVYDINNPTGSESLQDGNGCDYSVSVDLVFEECIEVGSISSNVFYDENGNGVQDAGESGISGAEVFIVYPDGTIDVATTDINGDFVFDDLEAGMYEIFVGNVPGFEATTPNTFVVDLDAGEDYRSGATIFGFDLPEQVTINCSEFLVDYTAVCSEDNNTFTVTVTVTGFDASEGYIISSTNPIIDGTVYTTESFVDGPYGEGIGFNYQISPVSDPSCVQSISVSAFACTVTAIELVEFEGRVLENANQLMWTTASEIENDYFIVERSLDGVNFSSIATVNGNGNSSNINTYSFNDNDVQNGASYYRLKTVDFNGVVEIASQVINLNRSNIGTIEVSPIPASDILNISLGNVSDVSTITIFDISGKIVKEVSVNSGSVNYPLNISDLATGAYFLQATVGNNSVLTSRFIKK